MNDSYMGICIVHAHFENIECKSDLSANDSLSQSRIIERDLRIDLDNFLPDKLRTNRGVGYITTISNKQYVITCNHIMIKYASYKGYCVKKKSKTIKFDMKILHRIPEIDIVIMEIISPLKNPLPEMKLNHDINSVYTKTKNSNEIITGEYIPNDGTNKIQYKKIDVKNDINIIFDILKSTHIHQFPLHDIPIDQIDIFMEYVTEYKKHSHRSPKRKNIVKNIFEKFGGLSGSIVRSNDQNISMICMITDTETGLSLRAIPLFMINIVINNVIQKNITELMGMQIDTEPCDVEYQGNDMYVHQVYNQSCSYKNGKKVFIFNSGDIITEINGQKFNKDKKLWSDIMKMHVPLNTYMMLTSNVYPEKSISVQIVKNTKQNVTIRNLTPESYNHMYRIKIFSPDYFYWKGLLFIEMSESLITFYARLGIIITNESHDNHYKINNDVIILLLNYNNNIPSDGMTLATYKSLPIHGINGNYFYTLNFIGQKRISNFEDLQSVLNNETINNKKINFKLSDDQGNVVKFEKLLETSC